MPASENGPRVEQNDPGSYGAKLRVYREAAGRTQGGIAERIGVPRNTYVRWENDRLAPKAKYLRALAAALGCELSDVVP